MSEFTSGNLTLVSFKEKIVHEGLSYVNELNEDWLVFFTDETMINDEASERVIRMSEKAPILYFFNAEDHGWGYRIIHNKEVVAKVDVSYDLEETMLMKLVEERHPDVEDPIELFYIDDEGEELRAQYAEEIRASSDFDDAIAKQFINRNIEHFRLFNVNEAQLEQLGTLLTKEYLQQLEFQQHLVEQFKELLNLQEMSWIRPDRIHNL